MKSNTVAQTFIEYTILISIVAMAVSALIPMLRRGSQSLIKAGADQIADQASGEQDFESSGYLRLQQTDTSVGTNKQKMALHFLVSEIESEKTISQSNSEYQLSGGE